MYTNMLKVALSDLPCFFCHVTCHMSPIFFQVLFISQNCTSQFCYPGGFTRVRSLGISLLAPDARQISSKAHCKGWTLQLIEYETVPTTFEYIEVGFHLGKSFISTVLWNGRNAKTAVLRISKKRLWQNSVTGLKGICEHWWVESCISNWCFKHLGPQAVKIG